MNYRGVVSNEPSITGYNESMVVFSKEVGDIVGSSPIIRSMYSSGKFPYDMYLFKSNSRFGKKYKACDARVPSEIKNLVELLKENFGTELGIFRNFSITKIEEHYELVVQGSNVEITIHFKSVNGNLKFFSGRYYDMCNGNENICSYLQKVIEVVTERMPVTVYSIEYFLGKECNRVKNSYLGISEANRVNGMEVVEYIKGEYCIAYLEV